MSEILWLAACVVLLASSGFFSGTEMGLYCVNRLRVRLRAEHQPQWSTRSLWWMMRHPQDTVVAILVGNNLANYLLTVSATYLAMEVMELSPTASKFYMAAVLSPLVFVFGDVVPKNWFQLDADRLMGRSALLLGGCVFVLRSTGILWLMRQMNRLVVWLTGHGTARDLDSPRGEVLGLLHEGGAFGALTADQAEIIERVMNLSTVSVGSIMVPRRSVVTVPLDVGRARLYHIIASCSHSRLPVVGVDGRSIIGIVDIHDVLTAETHRPLQEFLKPPLTIPASASAAAALLDLQKAEVSMAIITDPRRGVVGIVTLKDVVEEIFGELPEW